jgi:competence protein ComEA
MKITETTDAHPTSLTSRRERGGIALGATLLVSALVGGGIYQQTRATHVTPLQPVQTNIASISAPKPETEITSKSSPAPLTSVVVHIAGAVKKPGVYTLKDGTRIYQAIAIAGGFQKDAQQDAVNLADTLRDADQIYIPRKTETTTISLSAPTRPTVIKGNSRQKTEIKTGRVLGKSLVAAKPAKVTKAKTKSVKSVSGVATQPEPAEETKSTKLQEPGEGYVHLNSATTEDLQKLPGVGPAMAERILTYRKEIKKFEDPTQLKDVPGIGEKKFARMEPFLQL